MVKQKETKPSQVVIFVEGDTDEILFKALIEYYSQKGYQTKELVDALRMEIIRKKHADDLSELEKALNVTIQ